MFVFLDLQGRNPNIVIVLERQLNGLLQIHGARDRGILSLSHCANLSC
jgi:hypothetical protein